MRRWPIVILIALCACPGGKAPRDGGAVGSCHPARLLGAGDALPACSFRAFDGSVLDLTSLRGTPLVLNFWASWCAECLKEMPAFDRVHRQKGPAAAIYGANVLGPEGETEAAARRYAAARGVTYPLFFDRDGQLFGSFSQRTLLPVTIFVDASGVVRFRQFGALDEQDLVSLMHEHLGV